MMRKLFLILLVGLLSACSPNPASLASTIEPLSPSGWAGQGYTGHLILIRFGTDGNTLVSLDLSTGAFQTLFQAAEYSWLNAAAVSPDNQNILLAYAPPPKEKAVNYAYSDLYLLPIQGGGQPKPFLLRKDPKESFFNPTWTPDGKSVLYTHLYPTSSGSATAYQNDIEKAAMDGQPKTLIPNCLWPVLSPDGKKLAYLTVDPATNGNDLYIADPDGSNAEPVISAGGLPVDAHFFTKDSNQIIFSMVNPQTPTPTSWLDWIFGIEPAYAHNVPSDWYAVTLPGGNPERLTHMDDTGLYGDLSPDGRQIAFINHTGLYIMNVDGSNIIQLSTDAFIGTIDWIP